jgi:small subunit ribosomal protein S14
MAKESMKAREAKREKLVAKYAEKRKALLEAGDYEGLNYLKTLLLFACTTVAS